MPPLSNADKQDRFRKKEHLKRHADRIFRDWEVSIGRFRESRTPQEVRHALDKAVELPSGWTDEDFQHALKRLGQYHLDLVSSVDQIANDVDGDWTSHAKEFTTTPNPVQFIANNKKAIEKARALADHMISALKLSNCDDADQAAALMEVLRFAGRSLVSNREIRRSQATAMCLAAIGPQYDRPEWFAEQIAETISRQLDKRLAYKVGQHLTQR